MGINVGQYVGQTRVYKKYTSNMVIATMKSDQLHSNARNYVRRNQLVFATPVVFTYVDS